MSSLLQASQQQNSRTNTFWIYITVGLTLVASTAFATYHLIEQDRRVKRRKQTKQAERQVLRLIHQIQLDRQTIHNDIEGLTRVLLQTAQHTTSIDTTTDDKEWKRRDFILAECNELLLRLLERLDAIRPKSAILGEDIEGQGQQEPSALEQAAILDIRNRKKKVIRQIERNFRQLDQCKDLMNGMGVDQ
ncbi:uncharacterized protein BX664DRAFT_339019 [Halteromyces radiatus]|uniref:uncharacterized protein n=1 Tax=Halteromyces radiatus TaxID=101107 RepID=UPI00221EC178|nr:uncharacterized protein BX664DRAFT_339019 [Halteromyces radiatus]KAI8082770.1 hypothetical protein BX664DRAFT_339019 [Halteromyces radiatus]